MRLYVGIDLHSNNSVLVILDERDRTLYERRLPNDLPLPREADLEGGRLKRLLGPGAVKSVSVVHRR